jgi:ABC-type Fe3+/spermidine/putrescine transport system ATPase subunit
VAGFLGLSNLLAGEVKQDGSKLWVETELGQWPAPAGSQAGSATVLLRPDAVHLDRKGPISIKGIVRQQHFQGSSLLSEVEVNGKHLSFEVPALQRIPEIGETLHISFDPEQAVQIFPPNE